MTLTPSSRRPHALGAWSYKDPLQMQIVGLGAQYFWPTDYKPGVPTMHSLGSITCQKAHRTQDNSVPSTWAVYYKGYNSGTASRGVPRARGGERDRSSSPGPSTRLPNIYKVHKKKKNVDFTLYNTNQPLASQPSKLLKLPSCSGEHFVDTRICCHL